MLLVVVDLDVEISARPPGVVAAAGTDRGRCRGGAREKIENLVSVPGPGRQVYGAPLVVVSPLQPRSPMRVPRGGDSRPESRKVASSLTTYLLRGGLSI